MINGKMLMEKRKGKKRILENTMKMPTCLMKKMKK